MPCQLPTRVFSFSHAGFAGFASPRVDAPASQGITRMATRTFVCFMVSSFFHSYRFPRGVYGILPSVSKGKIERPTKGNPTAVGESSTRGKPAAVDGAGRRPALTHAGGVQRLLEPTAKGIPTAVGNAGRSPAFTRTPLESTDA